MRLPPAEGEYLDPPPDGCACREYFRTPTTLLPPADSPYGMAPRSHTLGLAVARLHPRAGTLQGVGLSGRGCPARSFEESGFSFVEVLTVIAILSVVIALALPGVTNLMSDYRLHSDAAAVASLLNLARMRAASQYAPYRLDASISGKTYVLERLCGNTPSSGSGSDANCTSAYNSFSTAGYDATGTQYTAPGDSFASCLPSGIATYPGTIAANPAGCPSSPPDPLQLRFNTRGAPVDATGSPLASGGAALYLVSQNSKVDAVTVSVGGRVTVWNWDVKAGQWYAR